MNNCDDLKETRKFIRLFQLQLHGVLEGMAKPSEVLSGQFSEVLLELHSIREYASEDGEIDQNVILKKLDEVTATMFECVSSMQFLDAKKQRIEHVADGLCSLITFDDSEQNLSSSWGEIQQRIEGQYKMEKERKVYMQFLQEVDPQQAVEYLKAAQ